MVLRRRVPGRALVAGLLLATAPARGVAEEPAGASRELEGLVAWMEDLRALHARERGIYLEIAGEADEIRHPIGAGLKVAVELPAAPRVRGLGDAASDFPGYLPAELIEDLDEQIAAAYDQGREDWAHRATPRPEHHPGLRRFPDEARPLLPVWIQHAGWSHSADRGWSFRPLGEEARRSRAVLLLLAGPDLPSYPRPEHYERAWVGSRSLQRRFLRRAQAIAPGDPGDPEPVVGNPADLAARLAADQGRAQAALQRARAYRPDVRRRFGPIPNQWRNDGEWTRLEEAYSRAMAGYARDLDLLHRAIEEHSRQRVRSMIRYRRDALERPEVSIGVGSGPADPAPIAADRPAAVPEPTLSGLFGMGSSEVAGHTRGVASPGLSAAPPRPVGLEEKRALLEARFLAVLPAVLREGIEARLARSYLCGWYDRLESWMDASPQDVARIDADRLVAEFPRKLAGRVPAPAAD